MILSLEHLTKYYDEVLAVQDFSCVLESNQVIGLVGPNGAGKTTLFKMVSNFLNPDKGKILLNHGAIVHGAVAYIPEYPELFPALSVWEHFQFIAMACRINDWELKAEQLLEQFQLKHKKDSLAGELSKGMRHKLMVGITLLRQPPILLMDEPFSGLDPVSVYELRKMIAQLVAPDRIIVISSHNLGTIQNICQRVLIMNQGELISDQNIESIFTEIKDKGYCTLEELYLEVTGNGTG